MASNPQQPLIDFANDLIKQRDDLLFAAKNALVYLQKIHLHSVYNENLLNNFIAVRKELNNAIKLKGTKK